MGEAADALVGIIFLLGDKVRNSLAIAAESDDLSEVRKLVKEADETMSVIIQRARAAQAEIDGASNA